MKIKTLSLCERIQRDYPYLQTQFISQFPTQTTGQHHFMRATSCSVSLEYSVIATRASHGYPSPPQLCLGCSDGQSFPDRRVEMRAVRRPASNSGRDSPTGNHSENPQLSRPAIPCATFEACCSRRLSKLLLALIQYTCALPSQHARSTIRSLTVFAAPQHAGLNSPAQVGPGQHRTSGHNPDLCDSLDGTPPLKTAIRKILLTGTQLP